MLNVNIAPPHILLDPPLIFVKVGRAQTWEDNVAEEKILPVSCTVIQVNDTMIHEDFQSQQLDKVLESITGSWQFTAIAIKYGAGISIDLSNIRAKGIVGRGGNISGGVTNFMPIFSSVIKGTRQGKGGQKKGAGLLYLNSSHNDLIDFLELPLSFTPDVKRAVYLEESIFEKGNEVKLAAIIKAVDSGSIFLAKITYNKKGERLYSNLCTETLMKSRGTCILGQVNYGAFCYDNFSVYQDIAEGIVNSAQELMKLWGESEKAIKNSSLFLAPKEDKQIGLGGIGLANLLAFHKVSYKEFVQDLEDCLTFDSHSPTLASAIYEGHMQAGKIARAEGFERAFAIAPTASTSYRNYDCQGFVTTPEISPPVAHSITKISRRQTRDGFQDYQYPLNVELAGKDVSWQTYDRLVIAWQEMMDRTGLAHAISYNWWDVKPVNKQTIIDWFSSPLVSVYYRWPTDVEASDKSRADVQESEEITEFWDDEDSSLEYCEACSG
jgi:Ribonucleotide reductase, barrel domain